MCTVAQNVYSICAPWQWPGPVGCPVCCTSCVCSLPAGPMPCSRVQSFYPTADHLKHTFVTAMLHTKQHLQEFLHLVACTMSTNQVADTRLCMSCDFGHHGQAPASTRYSKRTRNFLCYSNPSRNFLENVRVASSTYHLRW